ncbi:MAG: phage major capsid protein [Hyphomicrobiales bacterium]
MRSALNECARKQKTEDFLGRLNPADIAFLQRDWPTWARDDQLPPRHSDWTTWLVLGGRGAGKTRTGAEWVRARAKRAGERIALVGGTLGEVRSVMIEGVSGLMAVHAPGEHPKFEPSKRQLVWPNGAIAQMCSAEEPDGLRGPQFSSAWCDEACKWKHAAETWDMLQFALRLGDRPRQVVTTTPRPIPLLKRLMEDASTALNRATQAEIRKIKDADGNYIWQPGEQAGATPTLLNYPIAESEDMPDIDSDSYSIAFGDFRRGYLIVDRVGLRVLRDPYSAKPYVLFYTTKRVGGGVQDFDALKLLKFGTS